MRDGAWWDLDKLTGPVACGFLVRDKSEQVFPGVVTGHKWSGTVEESLYFLQGINPAGGASQSTAISEDGPLDYQILGWPTITLGNAHQPLQPLERFVTGDYSALGYKLAVIVRTEDLV
jgi:hypothetical protein